MVEERVKDKEREEEEDSSSDGRETNDAETDGWDGWIVLLTFFFVEDGQCPLKNTARRVQFWISDVKEACIHPDRLVLLVFFQHCYVERLGLVKLAALFEIQSHLTMHFKRLVIA